MLCLMYTSVSAMILRRASSVSKLEMHFEHLHCVLSLSCLQLDVGIHVVLHVLECQLTIVHDQVAWNSIGIGKSPAPALCHPASVAR